MIIKELFAKLGLDIDELGFSKADTLIGGIKQGLIALTGMLTAAAGGLAVMIHETSGVADKIDETAQAVGITTDALQELTYAAGFSGLEIEGVAKGLTILTRNMNAAADGGEEQAKAFAKAGVAVKNADGSLRAADDVLMDLADHFGSMEDGADKTALALGLFGKSGVQMIPFLNAGRDGIAELRAEAQDLGLVMNEDTIKAGAALDDTITRLHGALKGLTFAIAGPLMPAVNDVGKAVLEWVRANRELIKQRVNKVVDVLRVVFKALGIVLDGMWKTLGFIIDHWKLLAMILGTVLLAALIANAGAIWAAVTGYVAAGAAAVASGLAAAAAWTAANYPIVLLAVLLLAALLIIDDISTGLKGGRSLLKEWLGDWNDDNPNDPWWLRDFKTLIYGILHSGEVFDFWKKEFSDFWKYIEYGFEKVSGLVGDVLEDVFGFFRDTFGIGDKATKKDKKSRGSAPHTDLVEDFDPDRDLGLGEDGGAALDQDLKAVTKPHAFFGGGGTPTAGGQKTAAFNATIQVYGAPGQAPDDVAGAAVGKFDDWYRDELERANNAVG